MTDHPKLQVRAYKVSTLSTDGAGEHTFDLDDANGGPKRTVTVAQYYWDQYQIKCAGPFLLCICAREREGG